MSWSIQVIGRPDKIVERLEKESEKLTGDSKAEFDEAKPHLQALVLQTLGEGVLVKLAASGHASFIKSLDRTESKKISGTCSVAIDLLYGELAL